jgi:hypothetical protein
MSTTDQNTLNSQAVNLTELANILAGIKTNTADTNVGQVVQTVGRPWVDPPPNSVPFQQQDVVSLPAVGVGAIITSFSCPIGSDGVINAWGWNYLAGGFNQGSGDLVVQIRRNGAVIQNLGNIRVEIGSFQFPRPISPLRIYSGQTIDIYITHVANISLGSSMASGCLQGYTYPIGE